MRWIEQLDRDAVFPELACVDVWAAARVPGTPGGLFIYARAGAWEYEWDAATRSERTRPSSCGSVEDVDRVVR
jgi:hypothetical protein